MWVFPFSDGTWRRVPRTCGSWPSEQSTGRPLPLLQPRRCNPPKPHPQGSCSPPSMLPAAVAVGQGRLQRQQQRPRLSLWGLGRTRTPGGARRWLQRQALWCVVLLSQGLFKCQRPYIYVSTIIPPVSVINQYCQRSFQSSMMLCHLLSAKGWTARAVIAHWLKEVLSSNLPHRTWTSNRHTPARTPSNLVTHPHVTNLSVTFPDPHAQCEPWALTEYANRTHTSCVKILQPLTTKAQPPKTPDFNLQIHSQTLNHGKTPTFDLQKP